mmetsp:Transcript_14734/g.20630  ORF Transcript_14734/g.20630 Transcript_14734/m.20630 type:complete len:93 (+) Transcript_14734:497-775(+)
MGKVKTYDIKKFTKKIIEATGLMKLQMVKKKIIIEYLYAIQTKKVRNKISYYAETLRKIKLAPKTLSNDILTKIKVRYNIFNTFNIMRIYKF